MFQTEEMMATIYNDGPVTLPLLRIRDALI
jgi:hypothetical protein